MEKQIRTREEYRETFLGVNHRKQALHYALDIRKFEIDLYWRRATYFWTLLATTFAGFFAVSIAEPTKSLLILLISCIGLVLALGWYLVNRGSKFWQNNWERHVDTLENEFMGPLYKTTISNADFPWLKFWEGYPYSVSKINQLISLFVVLVWFGLTVASFMNARHPASVYECSSFSLDAMAPWILVIGTTFFGFLLLHLGRSSAQGKSRNINFVTDHLASSDEK